MPLATIERALKDIRAGRPVIVLAGEDGALAGALVLAAQEITPAAMAFLTDHAGGPIRVAMAGAQLDRLGLALAHPAANGNPGHAAHSDADRAVAIRALVDVAASPIEPATPGHVAPLRAHDGGVFVHPGQAEAAVDLARLAGLAPIAVLCPILRADGRPADRAALEALAAAQNLVVVAIADLVVYRARHERLVMREVEARLPTDYGDFRLIAFSNTLNHDLDLALVMGEVDDGAPVLTRLHSECLTGDIFGSRRCDCGEQLHTALRRIAAEGRGALVYLRQEGRGIGLLNKLRAYGLQDAGLDTVQANEQLGFPADPRDYSLGAQILADLGVRRVRLLTNNPRKRSGLERHGLAVVERVPIIVEPNAANQGYLTTKRDKLGHLLDLLAGGE